MKILLLLSLFIFCAGAYAQTPSDQISVHSQENLLSDPGMVVGTITILPKDRFSGTYEFVFRGERREYGKTIITLKTQGRKRKKRFRPDYLDSNDNPVYVYVWKRNEGNYTFTNVDFSALLNIEKGAIHFPFSVKKETITYVGNIVVDENNKTYTLNNDHKERDLYLIKRKYPDSYWNKYLNGNIITEAAPPNKN